MTSYLRMLSLYRAPGTGPTFVAISNTTTGFASNPVLTLPTLVAGDTILLHLCYSTGTVSSQPAATGYTASHSFYTPSGNSYVPQIGGLMKTATSGDSGANVTVTSNATGTYSAFATVWRDVTQVRTSPTPTTATGAATSVDPADTTPIHADDAVVVVTAIRSGSTNLTGGCGGFTGFTEAGDNENAHATLGIGAYYQLSAGTSSVDPSAQLGTVEHSEWSALTLVLGAS